MSITAFFAVCVISIDFMIYFFFKLLYAEKKDRVVRRRLPPEYYEDEFSAGCGGESSPAQLVPARKNRLARAMSVLSMPTPKVNQPDSRGRKRQRDEAFPSKDSAELLAHRRIVSLHAHASPDRKAG